MTPLTREILRKSLHLSMVILVIICAYLYTHFSPRVAILSLTALLLVILEIEYFRIDYRNKLGKDFNSFLAKTMLRKHEQSNLGGSTFFIISTIITLASFDYEVALASLLMLIFGDVTAAIVGTLFGKRKIFRQKSYAGTLSGLAANLIVGAVMLPTLPLVFIPMALTASVVETLTQKLDDNLTVPIFAGFVGQMIVTIIQTV